MHVGHYEITGEIARGGGGVVFRGNDPRLGREVAIKFLRFGAQSTPRERNRFEREGLALAKLRHPNIVTLHEIGVHPTQGPYLVMDLIHGEGLDKKIERDGPLDEDDAAVLVKKIALALSHVHAEGVLHRDVKPSNVLLSREGEPLLTDFGLAKDLDAERSRLTRTGVGMGTPGFWSPEQARGAVDQVGPRSDIYGLGATLYTCLTAELPIRATSVAEYVIATERQEVTPPSRVRTTVSPELDAICLRCLEKEPLDRYGSAIDLANDLEQFLEHGVGPKRRRRRRRDSVTIPTWAVVSLGGVAALGVATLVGIGYAQSLTQDQLDQSRRQLEAAQAQLANVQITIDSATSAKKRAEAALTKEVQARAKADQELAKAKAYIQGELASMRETEARNNRRINEMGKRLEGLSNDTNALKDKAWAQYTQALGLAREEQHRLALKLFDKALTLDKKLAIAYLARAYSRRELGLTSGAREDLVRFLALEPRHALAPGAQEELTALRQR